MSAWRRFWGLPVWAKIAIVGGWTTVVLLAIVLVVSARGGGEGLTQVRSPTAAPSTVVSDVLAASTPTRIPPTKPPAATKLPDRNDCDAMRGTDYRSPAERDWFLANCVTQVPEPVQVAAAPIEPAEAPPPLLNSPQPLFAPGEATALAVAWFYAHGEELFQSPFPIFSTSISSDCAELWIGMSWEVTCDVGVRYSCPPNIFCSENIAMTFCVFEASRAVQRC